MRLPTVWTKMALPRERAIGATFELDRQARGELPLVPARDLTAAAPPLAQLRDNRLGPGQTRAAAGMLQSRSASSA